MFTTKVQIFFIITFTMRSFLRSYKAHNFIVIILDMMVYLRPLKPSCKYEPLLNSKVGFVFKAICRQHLRLSTWSIIIPHAIPQNTPMFPPFHISPSNALVLFLRFASNYSLLLIGIIVFVVQDFVTTGYLREKPLPWGSCLGHFCNNTP